MSDNRRKLIALDQEDLQVISAHCQDAVLKVGDLNYFPAESRFAIAMNRFVWEKGERQNDSRQNGVTQSLGNKCFSFDYQKDATKRARNRGDNADD